VLRANGGGAGAIARLLSGVVLTLVLPAAVVGVALERIVLGPALSNLAAGYASLQLGAGTDQMAAVVAGLLLAGALAIAWVTSRVTATPVVAGLAGT
jgi:hypothetical protein